MKALALLLFAAAPCALAAEPAGTPADPVAPFRQVHVTDRSKDAAGASFTIGTVRYAFESGTLRTLVASDGSPAGFYFEGAGTLTFTPDDPAAARVFDDNASRLGGFDTVTGGALRAGFSRASFWLSDAARPALEGFAPGSAAPEAAFEAHRKRFSRDRFPEPEPALAAARLERRAYAQVLIEGSKDIRHELDDLFAGTERIAVVAPMQAAPSGFVDWRFSRDVAFRPVGRARHTAPRVDWKLVDLDVDVRELKDEGWGELAVKETLVPERPIRAIGFALRSERAMNRGLSAMATRLREVKGEDGRSVPFDFAKDRLVVYLAAEAPAGKPVRLSFAYTAPYFGRPGGDNYWELGLGEGWYPAADEWRASSSFTYHAVVRARKPYTPFTSGDTVRREPDGEFNLVETRLQHPVSAVGALAGTYSIQEETKDGITCRVASYAVPKEKSGAKLINLFHLFRKFYEPYFGPFPYKEYTIVEINDFGFGQAPPGMMRITHEAFQMNIFGDPQAELFSQGINERIAHELAHAWWGDVVWGASDEEQWIEEAFAEAAAGRAIEELRSEGDFKRLTNVWRTRASDAKKVAPIWLANAMSDKASLQPTHSSFEDRFYLVYFKGATLLQAIRKEVGDDAFYTVLKSFLRSFEKRPAVTTEQFIGLLSYVTKKDWKPWFDRYYYGFDMP